MNRQNMTIEELNAIKSRIFIPATVYTCILMAIGLLGNTGTVLVFISKANRSNYKYFVLTLAFLDLVACTLTMPGVVADLSLPYLFPSAGICKTLRFGYFYIACGSTLTHILMALERYRKVCHPLKTQLSHFLAKVLLGIIVFVLAPTGASPSAVFFGHRSVNTGVPNITGTQCQIDDSQIKSIYPTLYMWFLFVCVIISIGIVSACYIAIAQKIRNRNRFVHGLQMTLTLQLQSYPGQGSVTDFDKEERSNDYSRRDRAYSIPNSGKREHGTTTKDNQQRPCNSRKISFCLAEASKKRTISRSKITSISLAVTVVFAVSFCPYLALTIASYMKSSFVDNMTDTQESVYMLAKQLFMIHNVVNPLVYFTMDREFRDTCSSMFCRKTSRRQAGDVV